jgi:hypothetical protein
MLGGKQGCEKNLVFQHQAQVSNKVLYGNLFSSCAMKPSYL